MATMDKTQPPARRLVVGDPAAIPLATDIDRRQCKREVPMEVLCLGLSRTGTASLRQALLDLGYNDVYHYAAMHNENPRDGEMWLEAMDAKFHGKGKPFTRHDWDQLLGHCMAVTDTPCAIFYRELLEAYPDAKVILTVRDSPEQWWQSQQATLIGFIMALSERKGFLVQLMMRFAPKPGPSEMMARRVFEDYEMYQLLFRDYKLGTKDAMKWYEDYIAEIKRIVPKEQLLVMNVREGWRPLCQFLGKEVPAWAFPKVNSTAEFQHNMARTGEYMSRIVMWNIAKSLSPIIAAFVAGIAWWMRS